MASGAQLNRWGNSGGVVLLTLNSAASAIALPNYGTVGTNDSGGYVGAIGMTKWIFQKIGAGTGYTVTLLGTINPAAYQAYTNGGAGDPIGTSAIPASDWFVLPGPSEQSGTGIIANPLTDTTPILTVSMPLVAVRAVLTAVSGTQSGVAQIVGFAVP